MTSFAPAPAGAGRAVSTLIAASTIQVCAAAGFIAMSLLAPSLAAATGLNERDFGLSVSFFFVGTALSSPFSGALVRALGSVTALLAAMVFMALVFLICLWGSWTAVMLAALLFGMGYGPSGPIGMTLVTRRTPPGRRGLFLSLRQAAQPFAAAVGGRVLPPLMAVAGWQAGVYATSGLLLCGAIVVLLAAPLFRIDRAEVPVPPQRHHAVSRSISAVIAYLSVPRELRLLWGAGLVFAITQIAMMIFSYLYLLEVVGLSAIAAGIFVSNQQIAGMVGRPMLGWICDVTGRSQVVLGAIALVTVATVAALSFASADMPFWQLTLLAAATGISGQTWNSVFTTAMSYHLAPEQLVEMNGRAFSFLSFGWMAAAPLFWILIEVSGGYVLPFAAVMIANAIVGVVLLVFSGKSDRA